MTPLPPARGPALNTVGRVRAELAKVYREARAGEVSTRDLTRFVYALGQLARVIEMETIEARIDELEKRIEEGGTWQRGPRIV